MAFVINGGAHEHRLGTETLWAVMVAANLMTYCLLAWAVLLFVERIRQRRGSARPSEKRTR